MWDMLYTMFNKDIDLEKTADMIGDPEVVRNLVVMGLQQIKVGKTKDFDSVCDRLEEKYS